MSTGPSQHRFIDCTPWNHPSPAEIRCQHHHSVCISCCRCHGVLSWAISIYLSCQKSRLSHKKRARGPIQYNISEGFLVIYVLSPQPLCIHMSFTAKSRAEKCIKCSPLRINLSVWIRQPHLQSIASGNPRFCLACLVFLFFIFPSMTYFVQ